MAGGLAGLWAAIRERPVAATLELGSVACCVGLFLATLLALASGPPGLNAGVWLGIVVVGAGFVVFWTAAMALYERYVHGSG